MKNLSLIAFIVIAAAAVAGCGSSGSKESGAPIQAGDYSAAPGAPGATPGSPATPPPGEAGSTTGS